jgi:hypothetical protein
MHNRFVFLLLSIVSLGVLAGCSNLRSSQSSGDALIPNLTDLAQNGGLRVINRSASIVEEPGRRIVRLTQVPGEGVAWLEGIEFTTGTIEVDMRGKDVLQQSFVGIAFHGVNDSTFEAVYLRPFNFRTPDPVRRDHAVQYIAHPDFGWERLRTEYPEVYENPVQPAPDPNDWVHLRLEVDRDEVRAYVGEGEEPDLVVDRIWDLNRGWVGLWVGDNSDGDFANLRISPGQ